jgi:hypothetical protein
MTVARWFAIALLASLLVWVLVHHDMGRSKGTAVPLPNLISSLVGATVAAVITRRAWRAAAAPFVAGVVGSFAALDPLCGPYGAFTGLLVGFIVALLAIARLTKPSTHTGMP